MALTLFAIARAEAHGLPKPPDVEHRDCPTLDVRDGATSIQGVPAALGLLSVKTVTK